MAKNTGKGGRKGAIKGAVQYPIEGRWFVINTNTGNMYIRNNPAKGVRRG